MRSIWTLLGLVVTVAVVALLAVRQLDARRAPLAAAPAQAASQAADAVPTGAMSQQDARALSQQIQGDLNQALKQGEATRRDAVDAQ